ncbi:hypothetical protein [Mycolicibacterium chlorophenolicum]|uniref:Uncharacterized protein n=1 Tax=Mycolicibacterium chlorophenolicum TaxID=37916 RepID=A0A0J6V7W4_9MYCO|nr:hypothetical protein [Mycolicibacterium chlorophenolicum]KMO66940.1 hypothetical protein MCHLDSM_07284 [Mycolicibacterium chlorophenolicum]
MSSESSERWLELARRAPIGPKRGGLLRSSSTTDDVSAGQLRQAYWRESTVILLVVSVDDTSARAHAVPVSLEAGVEDRATVIVEADASPLYGPIAIWPDAAAEIPFGVLDTIIASIPRPLLEIITGTTTNRGAEEGLRRGKFDPPLGSGAAMAIDELFDAFEVLQAAPGLYISTSVKSVAQLDIPLPTIMTTLRVTQARAMAIRIGKEPLTRDEAQQLAAAADLAVDDVLAAVAPLPKDLARELQEPRWRPHIRQRAVDGDEGAARTQLGYEAYQLAARETGQGRQQWRQRLEAIIAAEGS